MPEFIGPYIKITSDACQPSILIVAYHLSGIFDRDQSGTINFQEFQQLWQYIQQWKGAFDRYDTDRSGAIEGQELHRAFAEMGFNVSSNFVSLVVTRYMQMCFTNLLFYAFHW